jgi:hypothetical protein
VTDGLERAFARHWILAYLITTDADGRDAPSDMPGLLRPNLEDRADFVSGSRILGRQQTRDRVRRAGVHVLARLAATWWREGLPRPVGETAPALRHTRDHGD